MSRSFTRAHALPLTAAGAALYLGWRLLGRRRDDLAGKVVLVTGGSRGLGLLLAREFARHGCKLIICARNEEELEAARQDLEQRDAEVFARRSSLAGTRVTVRGRVVKVNSGINDRNYLHLQDGSGSADAHDNDLTVTTTDRANPGDIVTATGVLATNKDSGVGFTYEAIVEDATVTR